MWCMALERGQQRDITCCHSIWHSVQTTIWVQPITRLCAFPQDWLSRAPVRVGAQHVILVGRETVLHVVRCRRPPACCLHLPIPLAEEGVGDPPALGMQHVRRHRRPVPIPSTSRGCPQAVPPDRGLGGHRRSPGLRMPAGGWLSTCGQVAPVRGLAGAWEGRVNRGGFLGAEGEGTVRRDGACREGAVRRVPLAVVHALVNG